MEDNKEMITGFMFDFLNFEKDSEYIIDYIDDNWETGTEDEVYQGLIEELEKRLIDSKFKTYFALDYGYKIRFRADCRKPIDPEDYEAMEEALEEIMDYFKREFDILLGIREDGKLILTEHSDLWHSYG